MKRNGFVLLTFLGILGTIWAQAPNDKFQLNAGVDGWIPNLGQIHNQRFETNNSVTHLWASGKGMNVQLHSDGISYDTYNPENRKVHFHRLDMKLLGANPEAHVEEEEPVGSVLNFYGASSPSGVKAKQFGRVAMRDVYPGIDAVYTVRKNLDAGVKYDFVIHSGADIAQVKLEYEGFDAATVTNEEIRFELSGRTLVESIPESWVTPGREKATVQYKVIEHSEDRLVVGLEWLDASVLEQNQTLVIDPIPVLRWGTYYGDTLPDVGAAVVTDTINKVYVAGHTQSLLTIATDGAHQQTYAGGGADAFVAKFSAHGVRVWSTYFGGSGDDRATDVAVDGLFEVYLVGNTNTVDDSLATDSAYQQLNAGGTDVFAAKFDSTGTLKWSTFLGGASNDTATACVVDTSGHVFISGYTESGAWLQDPEYAHAGGMDGFVVKLDADGMPVWSTYYGGPEDDFAFDVALDSLDYLFVIGTTFSDQGIATDGVHQSTQGGEEDAFAVCFNPDGTRKWGTYFGGSDNDVATGIAVYYDAIYLTGFTWSDTAIADSLSFQPEYSGEGDAFLVRLDSVGNKTWSTYFGDTLVEKSNAIAIDREGFVYIAGITNSENSLSTPGVHQDWLRGEYEGFIAKFDTIGNRVWGTYYGGFKSDDITGIDVYGVTSIYITGYTTSEYFVAYYGLDIEYAGNTDAFLARLDMERPTGGGGICAGGGGSGEPIDEYRICWQDSMEFSIVGGALGPNAHWVWYKEGCGGDGVFEAIGGTVWLAPDSTTTYYVRAESGSYYTHCQDITIQVVMPPTANISVNDTLLCAGDSLHLSAPAGEYYEYDWSGPLDFSSNEQFPVIDSLTTEHSGWYSLTIVNAPDCWDSDSIWVEVQDYPDFEVSFIDPECAGSMNGSIHITVPDSSAVVEWPELSITADSVSGLGEGLYSAVIHASGLCSATVPIELSAPPSPVDSVEVVPTSCGEDNGAIHVVLHEFAEDVTFSWEPNVSQGASASQLPPGDYEITVGDAEECFYTVSATVPESESISAEWIQIENVSCIGESDGYLEMMASGGSVPFTYNWSTGDSAVTALDSLASGQYSVTATDSAGCSATISTTLNEPDAISVSAEITAEICDNNGGAIFLEASDDQQLAFLWSHNQDTSPFLDELAAGEYSVQLTDSAGCTSSETYIVPEEGEISVSIVPDLATISEGETVAISTEVDPDTVDVTYSWEPSTGLSCSDCPNPTASPDSTTTYTLNVTSDEGCKDSGELLIVVEQICAEFFVPDIFSPNADGQNDEWCVYGECISTLEFQVFNRWGELVFASTEQDQCWDGEFQGAPVPSGTMVYTVRAVLEKGETIVESGNLTILR